MEGPERRQRPGPALAPARDGLGTQRNLNWSYRGSWLKTEIPPPGIFWKDSPALLLLMCQVCPGVGVACRSLSPSLGVGVSCRSQSLSPGLGCPAGHGRRLQNQPQRKGNAQPLSVFKNTKVIALQKYNRFVVRAPPPTPRPPMASAQLKRVTTAQISTFPLGLG